MREAKVKLKGQRKKKEKNGKEEKEEKKSKTKKMMMMMLQKFQLSLYHLWEGEKVNSQASEASVQKV